MAKRQNNRKKFSENILKKNENHSLLELCQSLEKLLNSLYFRSSYLYGGHQMEECDFCGDEVKKICPECGGCSGCCECNSD